MDDFGREEGISDVAVALAGCIMSKTGSMICGIDTEVSPLCVPEKDFGQVVDVSLQ